MVVTKVAALEVVLVMMVIRVKTCRDKEGTTKGQRPTANEYK